MLYLHTESSHELTTEFRATTTIEKRKKNTDFKKKKIIINKKPPTPRHRGPGENSGDRGKNNTAPTEPRRRSRSVELTSVPPRSVRLSAAQPDGDERGGDATDAKSLSRGRRAGAPLPVVGRTQQCVAFRLTMYLSYSALKRRKTMAGYAALAGVALLFLVLPVWRNGGATEEVGGIGGPQYFL